MLGSAALLLAQLAIVTAAARAGGAAARRLGQPEVFGEIAAGIALGPSLLGAAAPLFFERAFPAGSLGLLGRLAQLGVVVFMFLMGLELDRSLLRDRARSMLVVAKAGVLVPFALGVTLAVGLYGAHAPAGVAFPAFALFLGTAMSITAFPVLARILDERGLTRSPVGTTALACAAANDAVAWVLLAAVLALAGGPGTHSLGPLASLAAFVAGAAAPLDSAARRTTRARLTFVSARLLVPLYFAFTGLRTRLGLLDDAATWGMFALVMAAAVCGKLGGSAAAARWTGMSWPESLRLGVLMNTRGLMELVVLNIGYDLGLLSGELFAAMVLMALTTTAATGPALDLIDRLTTSARSVVPRAAKST